MMCSVNSMVPGSCLIIDFFSLADAVSGLGPLFFWYANGRLLSILMSSAATVLFLFDPSQSLFFKCFLFQWVFFKLNKKKKGGTFKIWLWLYKHTRTQYQTTAATNVTKAHQ